MLWFRKSKAHIAPFTDPNWNLVTLTDFPLETGYYRLHVPDNICWDLLSINMIVRTTLVTPYLWLWVEAHDRHLWTMATSASIPSGKIYHFCAAQGIIEVRAGINKEVLNTNLPIPCYMRPLDRLTIYLLPNGSGTTLSSITAVAREWRIY